MALRGGSFCRKRERGLVECVPRHCALSCSRRVYSDAIADVI